jgi:hypothetical protein
MSTWVQQRKQANIHKISYVSFKMDNRPIHAVLMKLVELFFEKK